MPNKEAIDAILPQTQCGLCSYDGCMPYAKAIAEENESINLCPPGGVEGLNALAKLTHQDPTPFVDSMKLKEKPTMVAIIREAECIGCTKCIQACPVDAIIGAGKLMHTVITDECSGCELCVEPCPVDCIDMLEIAAHPSKTERAAQYRKRYHAHNERLAQEALEKAKRHQAAKHAFKEETQDTSLMKDKKAYIMEAIKRAKERKA